MTSSASRSRRKRLEMGGALTADPAVLERAVGRAVAALQGEVFQHPQRIKKRAPAH